jgi:hypothetical protein
MPRNGTGTYTPYTPGNPVVANTTIDPTVENNTINDLATALTNSVARNGEATATGNWPMGSFKLTGLLAGSAQFDSVAWGQQSIGLARASDGVVAGQVGSRSGTSLSLYNGGGGTSEVVADAGTVTIYTGGVAAMTVDASQVIRPGTGGTQPLGSSAVRWGSVYSILGNFSGPLIVSGTSGGVGYGTGAGGAVTQITNKSGSVTLNTSTGQITMNNALLGSGAVATFLLISSAIAATDVLAVSCGGGNATAGTYTVLVDSVTAGQAVIQVKNISGGSLSEALKINFTVIKGVAA